MRHSSVRGRLSAYLESDLAPHQRAKIARHLADCDGCAAELRELEATVQLLRRLPEPELPAVLAERVMARVRAGEADPVGWLEWVRRAAQPAMAVPLAALAVGLALFSGDLQPVGASPTDGLHAESATEPPVRFVALERHPRRFASRAERLERLAQHRPDEVVRYLMGAGHPHSRSLAAHIQETEIAEVARASFSPGRRRR